MIKTFKFRLYPTKAQTTQLESWLDICCELYNAALSERREAWRLQRKSICYFDQQNVIPEIKDIREDLAAVSSMVLQDVLRRLDKTFNACFARLKKGKGGFPRFKSRKSYNSFTYPKPRTSLKKGKLYITKLGLFKVKWHREIVGEIKTLTIAKSSTGKWFACFTAEVTASPLPPTPKAIGIDVGIKSFATLSDGRQIENPKFFRRDERDLNQAHRNRNRRRAAKIHERIKNRRNNFIHQVSRGLVNNFGVIVFEKLQISNMVQNSRLAKSITDASWGKLFELTSYKAESAGRTMVQVNPRNTSQNCSQCGALVKKDLSIRLHACLGCGLEMDRDQNAAVNILALGLESLRNPALKAATRH